MVIMKGKNYTFFVAGIVGFIALACYPIIVEPMMNSDKYSKFSLSRLYKPGLRVFEDKFRSFLLSGTEKQQKINRAGLVQEEIQPGSKTLS